MLCKILRSFKGSQDGRFCEDFTEGEEREVSDYLASCLPAGSIEPVQKTVDVDNKAIITDGRRRTRSKSIKEQ